MKYISTIAFFLAFFNYNSWAADAPAARWWDCVFKRPATTFQLNTGKDNTLPAISVAFAVESPHNTSDDLGDPKQYRPTFDNGALTLTVSPEKIQFGVREESLGPINWPHSHLTNADVWTGKKPIDVEFERDITKGVARYQFHCVARQ